MATFGGLGVFFGLGVAVLVSGCGGGASGGPDAGGGAGTAGMGAPLTVSYYQAWLHLAGYRDMTLDEIKRFRQLGSRTAGHPEYGHADGIETTTGPACRPAPAACRMATVPGRVGGGRSRPPRRALAEAFGRLRLRRLVAGAPRDSRRLAKSPDGDARRLAGRG